MYKVFLKNGCFCFLSTIEEIKAKSDVDYYIVSELEGTPLERKCYIVEDLEKFRKLKYEEKINHLWGLACTGDTEALENIIDNWGYESMINSRNVQGSRYNRTHSFIMGAFRNGNFDTVDFLISRGGNIEEHEKAEIEPYINKKRIEILENLVGEMVNPEPNKELINKLMEKSKMFVKLII